MPMPQHLDKSLEQLKELVCSIHSFSKEEWEEFSALWKPHSAKRKEILTHPGEVERYLYFVVEGIQRVVYMDEQGREATLVFTYAPSFGGVLDSMLEGVSSHYFYETLSPSAFLRVSISDLQKQGQHLKAIESLIQKGLVGALSGVLERLVEVQCYSSEERFRSLLKRSPHILQRVPHKYLANYLGIDATNFSKLLNKVKL